MDDLRSLIERVEKATGPDRKLDEELFEFAKGRKRHISTFEQYEPSEPLTHYTSSLDAVVALVEREFIAPWYVERKKKGLYTAVMVVWPPRGDKTDPWVEHKTPALALLLAFLRAKEKNNG